MQFGSECQNAARRGVLRFFGWAALSLALPFAPAAWASAPRSISLYHTHTGEKLSLVYFEGGDYVPEALASLNNMLRDFRTGEVCDVDPRLFDQLYALNLACGEGTYEVVSAFRSQQTNLMLRQQSKGVAKDSLHVHGRAIDVRLSGRELRGLRDAALAMKQGGVGFYPRSNFMHLDTGAVRSW
jgi:uncharacterized protein YcbK (DUF882 family)